MNDARDHIAYLREIVPVMRSHGVTKFRDVELGPDPTKPPPREITLEEMKRKAQEREQKILDTQFAASTVRPNLPKREQ